MTGAETVPGGDTAQPSVESWPHLVGRLMFWLGWGVVALLLLVALLRLVAWDDLQVFAWADALGMVLYLPAWVIGIGAAVTRKWMLLGACLLVVAAQLAFGLPELTAAEPVPAAAAHAFKLRVFDANVTYTNPSVAGYVPQLRAYRPDLLTMEEITPSDTTQLQSAGVFRTLPHTYEIPDTGSRGFVIASRYPLGPTSVSSTFLPEYGQLPFLVRTSLRLPGLTLPLWVVHTTAPVNPGWNLWNVELQQRRPAARGATSGSVARGGGLQRDLGEPLVPRHLGHRADRRRGGPGPALRYDVVTGFHRASSGHPYRPRADELVAGRHDHRHRARARQPAPGPPRDGRRAAIGLSRPSLRPHGRSVVGLTSQEGMSRIGPGVRRSTRLGARAQNGGL